MSQENVEVVRDQYAATNERDFRRAVSHYAEDVEMVVPFGISAGTFTGRQAVGDWFADWFGAFVPGARFDIEEIVDLDETSVLLVATHRATGRASGVEIEGDVVWVYRLGGGKITHLRQYESRSEALKAVGLEE